MRIVSPRPPEGFAYHPRVLDTTEQQRLLAFLEDAPFSQVWFQGFLAGRRAVHYGFRYEFQGARLSPAAPLPPLLLELRDRCAALAGVDPVPFESALVVEYPIGSGVGWHRDARPFGPVVLGVTLMGLSRMRFRRSTESGVETFAQLLAPRSAYVLQGPARSEWQHTIPPVEERRLSVTFRSLRDRLPPDNPYP